MSLILAPAEFPASIRNRAGSSGTSTIAAAISGISFSRAIRARDSGPAARSCGVAKLLDKVSAVFFRGAMSFRSSAFVFAKSMQQVKGNKSLQRQAIRDTHPLPNCNLAAKTGCRNPHFYQYAEKLGVSRLRKCAIEARAETIVYARHIP